MNNKENYRFGTYKTHIHFTGSFDALREDAEPEEEHRQRIYVFDEETERLFGKKIPGGRQAARVVLSRGEESKSWESVSAVLEAAVANSCGRDGVFIGVGGGIVCDITAFAASVYMRGCRLTLVPTTLLAMVDASLGGKTGFNFAGYKNMAGTFYPAETVLLIPETLSTLPEKELLSGLAENIKHACLGDASLFQLLKRKKTEILTKKKDVITAMIGKSVAVKAAIVEKDLTEAGVRAYLNLGHTFAHALESVGNLTGSGHGEAVAWGLAMAVKTGTELGITDTDYGKQVLQLLRDYGYRLAWSVDPEQFLEALRQDKKKRKGRVRFVLQRNFGDTCIREVEDSVVYKVLADQAPR